VLGQLLTNPVRCSSWVLVVAELSAVRVTVRADTAIHDGGEVGLCWGSSRLTQFGVVVGSWSWRDLVR
jgi:hypothetical protein